MSDSKSHQFRPPLYHRENGDAKPSQTEGGNREQQGWDAYRKWLTSMNGAPIDHSIYSWKGYHSWADRVRQTWKPEEN